jgi:hypothetical protein
MLLLLLATKSSTRPSAGSAGIDGLHAAAVRRQEGGDGARATAREPVRVLHHERPDAPIREQRVAVGPLIGAARGDLGHRGHHPRAMGCGGVAQALQLVHGVLLLLGRGDARIERHPCWRGLRLPNPDRAGRQWVGIQGRHPG